MKQNYIFKYADGSMSRVYITPSKNAGMLMFESSHYGPDGYYQAQYSKYPIELTYQQWENAFNSAKDHGVNVQPN